MVQSRFPALALGIWCDAYDNLHAMVDELPGMEIMLMFLAEGVLEHAVFLSACSAAVIEGDKLRIVPRGVRARSMHPEILHRYGDRYVVSDGRECVLIIARSRQIMDVIDLMKRYTNNFTDLRD